ncbi:MAG: hypothetical protein ABI654_12425 [Betaproteobacteria bacterium]
MGFKWLSSFKDVPWSKVLELAPSIVDGGKKVWARVASEKVPDTTVPNPATQPALFNAETVAALEVKVSLLQRRISQLSEEAVASFDVVRSIAGQHSELVRVVDILLARTRTLIWICAALGVAVAVLLLVAIYR